MDRSISSIVAYTCNSMSSRWKPYNLVAVIQPISLSSFAMRWLSRPIVSTGIGRPHDSRERICTGTRVRRVQCSWRLYTRTLYGQSIWVTASDREILLLLLLTTIPFALSYSGAYSSSTTLTALFIIFLFYLVPIPSFPIPVEPCSTDVAYALKHFQNSL